MLAHHCVLRITCQASENHSEDGFESTEVMLAEEWSREGLLRGRRPTGCVIGQGFSQRDSQPIGGSGTWAPVKNPYPQVSP